jgi:hypothetical protein
VAVAHGNDFLVQACLYFAAAVAAVMISHRLRLAGIAIGPWGSASCPTRGRATCVTCSRCLSRSCTKCISNELRDQPARTLSEDQRRMAVAKPQQS